ncbi:DUF930 domain-containing protein [Aminobacter niigataensis]|uniref:DUF930 domain-containing protein n=1 Tax=Aminobacter niigataensis TaxID=83265 RepID=UPI0022841143|nr:DUF930 domain-containing protein [Aminobacter niigataensis]CAI2936501.1 conserved protein of unknown function [Aminobacter niigataensis]
MLPIFRSTSVGMAEETSNRRRDSLWALPASLILHGLLIAVLVAYSQPRPAQQPEEEAVNVTLTPPPEQPKPEPAPPPPPKAPEAKKPEEPKQPPAAETEPAKPAQIELLKPVFHFGDKDASSGKSPEEGGVQTPSPATGDGSKPPAEERPDATADAEKQADVAKDAQPAQDAANEATAPQDAGKQDKDKQEGLAEGLDQQTSAAPPPLRAVGSDGELALPALAKAPEPRPAAVPKPSRSEVPKLGGGSRAPSQENADVAASQPYSGLPGVRRPQSRGGDALSTTAMAGVPRDKRAAQLCASALQQQLLQASYSPDLVPLVPLKRGNVLDVPEAAFRTRTAWHALSYRCEVDADATTIRSLSFRVGATIPRDQWGRLGLPAND